MLEMLIVESLMEEFIKIFIHLAVLGLSCSMQNLSLWRVGFSTCGSQILELWALLPHDIKDLSSQARDGTHVLCIGRHILS